MVNIRILCVGRLKEKFYADACAEYAKRLSAYCRLEIEELPEVRRSAAPSPAETAAALKKEGDALLSRIPKGAYVIPMCIEGVQHDSVSFARLLEQAAAEGGGKLCFIIGGSDGLDGRVKEAGAARISMPKMTFPHHLARIMLLEQIYRGFKISAGGKYHK